jgi:predicted ATPase
MIRKLRLGAFKRFTDREFSLGKFNLLTGINGSGKSSVIQSLLCLRQSYEIGALEQGRLALNGRLVELGSGKDVFSANASTDELVIKLTGDKTTFVARAPYTPAFATVYSLPLESAVQAPAELGLFGGCFNYLTAERLGPRKMSPVLPERQNQWDVGKSGEHAPFIIASEIKERRVDNALVTLSDREGNTLPFLKFQWISWMAAIFPGFDADAIIDYATDYVRILYALDRITGTESALLVKPINAAFGVSYVLPIIVAGLIAEPNSVLLIENPEAHLHPAAQSRIGEFLARVACGGAQVFVETHSEHVLNGARRVVKQGLLSSDDFGLFFLSKGRTATKESDRIPLESTADLAQWPAGFFDQLDKDLQDLYG